MQENNIENHGGGGSDEGAEGAEGAVKRADNGRDSSRQSKEKAAEYSCYRPFFAPT